MEKLCWHHMITAHVKIIRQTPFSNEAIKHNWKAVEKSIMWTLKVISLLYILVKITNLISLTIYPSICYILSINASARQPTMQHYR